MEQFHICLAVCKGLGCCARGYGKLWKEAMICFLTEIRLVDQYVAMRFCIYETYAMIVLQCWMQYHGWCMAACFALVLPLGIVVAVGFKHSGVGGSWWPYVHGGWQVCCSESNDLP